MPESQPLVSYIASFLRLPVTKGKTGDNVSPTTGESVGSVLGFFFLIIIFSFYSILWISTLGLCLFIMSF